MQDVFFALHLTFLALAALGILMADKLAFAWLLGKTPTISPRRLLLLHWLVTIGLAGLVGTGLLMFWPLRLYLMHEPQFWAKMFLVFCLLVNSFFIEAFMHKATTHPFTSFTLNQKVPLFISGGVSALCWLGAAGLAFFLLP